MKLFILVSDGGDGSYHPVYTLDPALIAKMKEAADSGKMDYENGYGCDGDGFHYDTIEVPDGSTAESLGISKYGFIDEDFLEELE